MPLDWLSTTTPLSIHCSLFQSLRPELDRATSGANGGGAPAQAAAVDALALAAFVLAEDETATQEVMGRLRALWTKGRCLQVGNG